MSNTYQALLCDAEFLHNRMQSSSNKDEFRRLQAVWLRTAKGLSVNDISAVTCYSKSWVRQLHSLYRHGGIDALLAKEKGGRHNENLTVEEEKKFIRPFLDKAKSGGVLEIGKIHQAYEKQAERIVEAANFYEKNPQITKSIADWDWIINSYLTCNYYQTVKVLIVEWAKLSVNILAFAVLFLLLFFHLSAFASVEAEKSPNDVYRQVQFLTDDVRTLQKSNKINLPWPHVEIESGREARHVFQKGLEILGKINRYRINIIKTGGIAIPRFAGRDITPNEVYSLIVRLRQELAILVRGGNAENKAEIVINKTSNHVYTSLAEISIALGRTLGLRGITPSEVYTSSLQVLELVQFLRRSQNLPMNIPKPIRTKGRLPNHALKAVNVLLSKIKLSEQNLWMKQLKYQGVPRRVITLSDVYDAMCVVVAELRSIQFRLGLEREFPILKIHSGMTPDDVIQNTIWAAELLPQFELGRPLNQYDRSALKKTPNHVFFITKYILKKLRYYRRLRGIQVPPRKTRLIRNLKPQHVYGKALEVMEKINLLRRRQNLGAITVPRYPIRKITPLEVFDLSLRLDSELSIIYRQEEDEYIKQWVMDVAVDEYENKQPSDVFLNMQQISNLMDTILGSEGFTPNDVYREALTVKLDLDIIARYLGGTTSKKNSDVLVINAGIEPRDVFEYAKKLLDLMVIAKRRAGMFDVRNISVLAGENVTPSEVYNQVRLIETELTELKVFLGISTLPELIPPQKDKTPANVMNVLKNIEALLRSILHIGRI